MSLSNVKIGVSNLYKEGWSENTMCKFSDCSMSSNIAKISKICMSKCWTKFNFMSGFYKSAYTLTLGF